MVTVKTYRHIILEFQSEGCTTAELNAIADTKWDEICKEIGQAGVTGWSGEKKVFWTVNRGIESLETLELDGTELSIEADGSVKILEGYEHIGNRIFLKKEELDDVIRFLVNVRELNNK